MEKENKNIGRNSLGRFVKGSQIVGGTKNTVYIRNFDDKRIGRDIKKINWLSHNFKLKKESIFPPKPKVMGIQNAKLI